jgi:pyrophosphatase PpaX
LALSRFEAVLFDLDGTLLDTTQAILESFKYTIHHFAGRIPREEEIRPYMGLPLRDQFSIFLPGKEDEACRVYVEHNLSIHKDFVRPFPGAKYTLETLREKDVALALVTSKRCETATYGLLIAGIHGMFDAMVFYDDTTEHKPHPAPILKAIGLIADPEPCKSLLSETHILVVGDSPTDIEAAKNAQMVLMGPPTLYGNQTCPENCGNSASVCFGKKERTQVVIKSAGVTYGAYPKEVIEKTRPDYILTDITQVIELCGFDH